MLKKIRLTLAVIFFIGITLLFLDFTGTVQHGLGWMAKIQFLPNVLELHIPVLIALIALTLIFGRIYCSVICPLGVMQDVFAWIGKLKIFRKNRKSKLANRYSYSKPKTWLRLIVLVLFIVMLAAGFNAGIMILAPYSAYGRIVSSYLQPLYIGINNMLASWAENNDSYLFYQTDVHNNPAILLIVACATAIILFVLAFLNGRTYCNTICPVGTVLGYLSKFSLLKMKVDEDKCIKCGLCEKNCKAACISVKKGEPVKIDYTRCVDCGNCQVACTKGAIHLQPAHDRRKISSAVSDTGSNLRKEAADSSDMSRRSFLSVLGLAAAATAISKEKTTDGGFAVIEDKKAPERHTPLTPPGSLSARNLQKHCTACQLCIANCPNGVLRPNTSLEHLLQPVMEYDKGYCRPECTRCADVCPTGAIRPITVEEKPTVQIGHAVWIRKNCIPVTEGHTCGNCAKHCPQGAIHMVPVDKTIKVDKDGNCTDAAGNPLNSREVLRIPSVDTESCIGCGACENLCPARPFSAIYVEGHEVHRTI